MNGSSVCRVACLSLLLIVALALATSIPDTPLAAGRTILETRRSLEEAMSRLGP